MLENITAFELVNTMTMKQKLKIHKEIEAENKRKLDEWRKKVAA